MSIRKISLEISSSYDIFIGDGLISNAAEYISKAVSSKKFAIISDDNVSPLYSKTLEDSLSSLGFSFCKFVFPHGESSKSAETLLKIYNFLAENNITRSDCIIALGGGVVGDISGYAAASFLRGVNFINIPTSLLAQVDSSVGGKTAINISAGKNLVGAFKQPSLVLCDTKSLETLPLEYFIDGFGEIIKYAMISSEELFDILEKHDLDSIKPQLSDIIFRCLSIKADVVTSDEFDTGNRMLLNFGHTLGHAIEKFYNYSGISHGVAVGIGMFLVTKASCNHSMTDLSALERLSNCLKNYSITTKSPLSSYELGKLAFNDKKRLGGSINIVLCDKIGHSYLNKMSFEDFLEFLK